MMVVSFKRFSFFAFSFLFLGACSSDKDKPFIFPAACIRSMTVGELSETVHKSESKKDPSYVAAITHVWAKCEKKENQEHTVLSVRFLIKRPQAGTEQEIKVPYFVALADKNDAILFKKDYKSIASFTKHQKRALPIEQVDLTFSIPAGSTLEDLTLLVGLQMDESQLEKNIDKRKKTSVSSH